ncbi:MAG: sigma-70 family RNA polymerase sigma factor [Bryobacteraceae bacterium]
MTEPLLLADATEAELVQRAQQRDEEAFAELVRRNTSASFRLALSILKDRQEAEDEVQTSFLKAWINLPLFKSESRFSTWFRTIVANQSFMSLRKSRRVNLRSLDETDDDGRTMEVPTSEPGPEVELAQVELNAHLKTEVQKLPRILRDVLILRDLQQLSTEEAASRLGITESAIKSRLTRARNTLRQRMERHNGAPTLLV